METKTLLIADDHPIFRQGLRQVLESIEWIRVVAEAETGPSALLQIKQFEPDLVMLDIAMPGMDGLEVLQHMSEIECQCLPIVVTSYDESAYVERALDLGARAYVIKDAATDELLACLTAVVQGDLFVSQTLGGHSVKLPALDPAGLQALESLTNMERRVFSMVGEFKTSKKIAQELNLSHRTIQNHRANICRKLGLHGIHQLMNFAREHKID